MAAKDSPEELPAGWTALSKVLRTGRQVTIYTNLETGKSLFSKDDIFKYIKAGSSQAENPQPPNKDNERTVERSSSQVSHDIVSGPPLANEDSESHEEITSLQPESVNEIHEWLPDGWKVEMKTRKSGVHNGKPYKCYIDPLNKGKFYSKQEVLRYLVSLSHKKCKDVIVNDNNSALTGKTETSMLSADKVVIQRCEDEDLPPGWIKEIKIRQTSTAIRKDPFYTDPVSGYVFRSKKDALRYVETGRISRHAFKPKNPSTDAAELVTDEISTSSAAKRQKLTHPPSRRQLFSGKKGSEKNDLELSKIEGSKRSSAKVPLEARARASSGDEIAREEHPLDDATQVCVQAKKQHTRNNSQLAKEKDEPSKPTSNPSGDARSLHSGAELSEESQGKKDIAENGHVSTPEPNIMQDKKLIETVTEKGSAKEAQVKSRKSVGKKVHNLPPRSSKRLAGHEPDKVASLELGERALISSIRKSRESRTSQDTHLTSDDLAGGPSSSSIGPLEDPVPPEELYHKLENGKANNNSEPQLSFLFDSDPCLEFAFKTLTGELPLDDTSVNEATPIYTGGTVEHDKLLGNEVEKSSIGKGRASRSKPKNKKELNLPRRSSKRLNGGEPELIPTTKPCGQGIFSATKSLDSTNKQNSPRKVAELANHLFTKSAERPKKRDISFENLAAHPEHPQSHETGNVQLEKPEPAPKVHETGKVETGKQVEDLSFSIADYWSDPCLDFAFKTLTGVIPIEDSLLQGYFQEQVDFSNSKNCSSALPDFGTSSSFHTDVSPQFDAPGKSLADQQGLVTPSFLPAASVSFSSCSGVHSQQQSMEGNKDLQQKVKS